MNRRVSGSLLALIAWMGVSNVGAEDSRPLLKDGKVPQSLDELWGACNPRVEPLAVETVKEWELDGVFKGVPAKVAAFYSFPEGGAKPPGRVQIHGSSRKPIPPRPASTAVSWAANSPPIWRVSTSD